jgi:LacI family transcriptional regulator
MPETKSKRRRRSSGPTMAAVAAEAKVSVFTVSAVLNGTPFVGEERRLRVERAIEAIGYKRNAVARSLKTGRTMTIGVVVGDITNPFYTDVVAVVQHELHRAGYAVMLCCNDRSAELQAEHISLLRDRMVDGLIISPVGEDEGIQRALHGARIPVVLVDRILDGHQYDAVVLDNRSAVAEAMQYLFGLGTAGSASSPAARRHTPVASGSRAIGPRSNRPAFRRKPSFASLGASAPRRPMARPCGC